MLDELTPNANTVEVLVDDGSGVHVCPSNFGADYYPVDDTVEKLKMFDVQSRPIPRGGQRTIDMWGCDEMHVAPAGLVTIWGFGWLRRGCGQTS